MEPIKTLTNTTQDSKDMDELDEQSCQQFNLIQCKTTQKIKKKLRESLFIKWDVILIYEFCAAFTRTIQLFDNSKKKRNFKHYYTLKTVFFPKILKYSGLWPTSVFPWCQCVYTYQAGRTPALQQNWQSQEKSQNFKKKKHNI